jgi:transposase
MLSILTRQERERLVLDLYYNQGKTYREISKEARISPRDIRVILNKVNEEKKEASQEQQDNDDDKKHQKQEHRHLSLAAQAYKLFSDRKTPLEVAIALNLRESEATKFYKEYWKLKQLHNLNMVYEETNGDIEPFLRLYRLSKVKGKGVQQVVNLLAIVNNDLPSIEERFKRLRNDVSMLQFRKHTLERNIYQLNNQIASTTKLLNSLRMSCGRERREIEKLYNEKARLKALVTGFKSNNGDYLNKIKQAAEENVKSVLTDNKLLLKFSMRSIIESLRMNPELRNFVLYKISNNAYDSNYLSLMSRQQQHQSFNDSYTALILEEAEKLYNKLTTELTNRIIAAAAAAIRASSLPSSQAINNRYELTHKNDVYETESTVNSSS